MNSGKLLRLVNLSVRFCNVSMWRWQGRRAGKVRMERIKRRYVAAMGSEAPVGSLGLLFSKATRH